MHTVWLAWSLRSLTRKSSPWEINMLYTGVSLVTSKIPRKPAPKSSTQFRPSVHQRLGPPVGQKESNQSFRNGQQNKSRNCNFFSNAHITVGPLSRNLSRRTRGGPSKGARQWRSFGGGSPSCFCLAMAKPARWVQIVKNPAVGCPVEVGMSSASFDKDAHSFSKKQDLQKAVDSLLEKGAIEPVHRSRFLGFLSRLFLVPKKNGDLCPVIDLSTLNRYLVIPHLLMEMAQTVRAAVCQDKWTVSNLYTSRISKISIVL